MNFLNLNSPFVSGLYKIANMILLTLMWIVFCIPIFTIGASTSALYYTVQKNIKNSRGDSWSCFWEGFKSSFKKSTIVTLVLLAIIAVFLTDISVINILRDAGFLAGYSRIFFTVVIALIALYGFWAFAYVARFECKTKDVFKNAFILAIMHFPVTIVIALLMAFGIFVVWLVHILIIIIPPVVVLLMSYPMENVFRKYMTDDDKRLEDELNLERHSDYSDEGPAVDYVEEQQKRRTRIWRNKMGKNEEPEQKENQPQQSDYVRQQQEAMRARLEEQQNGGKKKRRR